MNDTESNSQPTTAVDDVRRVRQRIAEKHRGNLQEHMAETNRIFRELQARLKLRLVPPPPKTRQSGTAS